MDTQYLTTEEIEAGIKDVYRSPKNIGKIDLIVRRPNVEEREPLTSAKLDLNEGLVGDNWKARGSKSTVDGSAHPEMQLNIMNSRVIALLAQEKERWQLAGDQLYIDLDLSAENLPAGTRLSLGSAIIEITAEPHSGCKKFAARFGQDAIKFVNSSLGKELHLRGVNAKVIQPGTIQVGDTVKKIKEEHVKAVRFTGVNQPLQMQEIPTPEIGERDILVRVKAAGICHSDAHYRAGISPVKPTPLTLGHEVAGVVEKIGSQVSNLKVGERVCLHYNITCGDCYQCSTGNDQFCEKVLMLGHYTNGGYAEFISVPARNAIHLPDEIPFEEGATLMCASATAFHALRKSRVKVGEKVAIFGAGGLGQSAVQLAKAFGALEVYAVDINEDKLNLAAHYGAVPINANKVNAVEEIQKLTKNKGVDIAIEMIGLSHTMKQAIQCAGVMARVVIVGLSNQPLEIDTYNELLGNEVELIGSNDHLLQELPLLVDMARRKILDTSRVVTRTVALDADAINATLDELEKFGGDVRTVIVPASNLTAS